MPSTKARFSKCGHRGFGASCKRCLQADVLEKNGDARFAGEVVRLRGPQVKKGQRQPGNTFGEPISDS